MDFLKQIEIELKNKQYDTNLRSSIMSYTSKLITREVPVIYDMKHLSMYLNNSQETIEALIKRPELYYSKRKIKSKKGKEREIYIPNTELKYIQKWILENILYKFTPSQYSKGFTPNLSIYDNALPHINKKYVLNIDFKDFFFKYKF